MKIVMKFGGATLKNAADVERVAALVQRYAQQRHELVIVVSALQGVTDSLVEITKNISSARKRWLEKAVDSLAEKHTEAIKAVRDKKRSEKLAEDIRSLIENLRNIVLGISHIGELTPRSKDYLLSFGERLSAPIVAAAIESLGLRTRAFTGGEAGIMTDDNFGEAVPLMNVTTMQVRERLEPLLSEEIIPVISGYIASTQKGVTTTLGRGGSDYSAAVIGQSLKADELLFWKNVPGIMTADPSLCSSSRLIRRIAFDEAIEIAHFGARVIHPSALEVGLESDLTFRIGNILQPETEGTLIVRSLEESKPSKAIFRAISVIDKVYLINISGARLVGTPRVAARVLELLANEDIDVLMISQSSSEANFSIAIPEADADEAINILELYLLGTNLVREINGEPDYSIVAVVGRGMRGTPGVAANVFKSMADRRINIRTIAQGSSELNISFMVTQEDAKLAVEALHKDFGLS